MTELLRVRGRRIGQAELAQINGWLRAHPQWSRRRLSEEVATVWQWRTANGQLKDIAARDLLNRLEDRGLIHLPARRRVGGRRVPRAVQRLCPDDGLLESSPARAELPLSELRPLRCSLAEPGAAERARVARYLSAHHYLGYPDVLGQMHYLVQDRHGQDVACLLFGPAAWKVAARDALLGWSPEQREQRLGHLANNSRFLILPWRRTPHLASCVLALAIKHLRRDWPARHGVPLWLVETFVETARFSGACYRAANWRRVGQTTGRTRNDRAHSRQTPRKDVYLLPLVSRLECFRAGAQA